MKPADITRAKNALKAERQRLTEDRNAFEHAARKLTLDQARFRDDVAAAQRERGDVVVMLRKLCGRFGSNEWSDDDNLADVIEHYLLDPLRAHEATQLARLEQANDTVRRLLVDAERAPQRPQALRPSSEPVRRGVAPVRPVSGHEPSATPVPGSRYQPSCTCGWAGGVRLSEREALSDARAHARSALPIAKEA